MENFNRCIKNPYRRIIMTQLNFNAREVSPAEEYGIIPEGWYTAIIVESEMRPTKDGRGQYLSLQFKIMEGEHTNRIVFTNLNLKNANSIAQEIAYRQLSAIAHAVNVLDVQDSNQLHNLPLQIKVKVRPPQNGYGENNQIAAYKAVENQAQMQPQSQPQAQPQTQYQPPAQEQTSPEWATETESTPPWVQNG